MHPKGKGLESNTKENDAENTVINFTPTIKFDISGDTKGGRFDFSTNFTISLTSEPLGTEIPITSTINGSSTASGTWIIADENEIKLIINPSKTSVDVDTASFALSFPHVTKKLQDSISIQRIRIASEMLELAETTMSGEINNLEDFKDVTVSDNIMTLEIWENMITFTKQ